MLTFEFRDRVLDLNISGNDFKVNCDNELRDRAQKYHAAFSKMSGQLSKGEKTDDDFITLCKETVNDLLGTGAFNDIIKNRTPNVMDCSDLLMFIISEITEFFKKNNYLDRAAFYKANTTPEEKPSVANKKTNIRA